MTVYASMYQISVIGNFEYITPSSEYIRFFIAKFSNKNLIPTQFEESQVTLSWGKEPQKNSTSRVRLSDPEQNWDIKFFKDKVLITFSIQFENDNPKTKEDFISEACEYLSLLQEILKIPANRLGFVTYYLITDFDRSLVPPKNSTIIKSFQNTNFITYKSKMASRSEIKGDNYNEPINMLYDIEFADSLRRGSDIFEFNGLSLLIDINTLEENEPFRFNVDDIIKFLNNAVLIETDILSETLDILK